MRPRNLSSSPITDQGLTNLSEALKKLSSLKSINLNFDGYVTFVRWACWLDNMCSEITDQGLNNLGESLKTLNALKSINLNFEE